MILWLVAQLVFWLACMAALIGAVLVVVLAPPFLAARFVLRRVRA